MLLLLYGKESYRLQKKLEELRKNYQEKYKGEVSLEDIDGLLVSIQDLKDRFFQRSFFSRKKIFFLDNLFFNPPLQEEFLKDIKKFGAGEDLLVVFQKDFSPKKDILAAFKKAGKVQEFKPLKRGELKEWVEKEAQHLGISFFDEALDLLLDDFGNDLWRIANTIKKIAAFKKGSGDNQVGTKEIRNLAKPDLETNLFKTIDALAKKDKKTALRLIRENILKKHKPAAVLGMIIFQFRGLLLAKISQGRGYTFEEFKSLGILKPFPALKCWRAASNFSPDQLKKIYQKMLEIDLAVKQGRLDQAEGLKMLVAEV